MDMVIDFPREAERRYSAPPFVASAFHMTAAFPTASASFFVYPMPFMTFVLSSGKNIVIVRIIIVVIAIVVRITVIIWIIVVRTVTRIADTTGACDDQAHDEN